MIQRRQYITVREYGAEYIEQNINDRNDDNLDIYTIEEEDEPEFDPIGD